MRHDPVRCLFLLLVSAALTAGAAADTFDHHTLVEVRVLTAGDVAALYDQRIDILGRTGDRFEALVTAEQLADLVGRGLPVEVLHEKMARERARRANPGFCGTTPWPCYYTPSAFDMVSPPEGSLMEHLLQLHQAHPDITRLHDIGDSEDGNYDIIAMEVTDNPDEDEFEPEIRMYSNIHGDEVSSLMVNVSVLDWILDNYPADPDARKLVEEAETWFIPLGNPWGEAYRTRYNSNGVDLNRNFWGPAGSSEPPAWSESETRAIRDLTEVMGRRFTTSVSYHSGAICFNAVYNYTHAATSDEPIFFSARTGGPNGGAMPAPGGLAAAYYADCTTPGFWYTNGADWYITYGDTNDWSYYVWSDLDTTLELTSSKWPDSSQIPIYTEQHRRASLNYMLKTFQGIHGRITDGDSGAPLDGTMVATATASDAVPVPHEYKEVLTDPVAGDFHRVLQPGTYTVTCKAADYPDMIIEGVVVSEDQETVVDCPMGGVVCSATVPQSGYVNEALPFNSTASAGGGEPAFDWDFGDGSAHGTEQNVTHAYADPGTYDWVLTVTSEDDTCVEEGSILIEIPCTISCGAGASPTAGEAPLTVAFDAAATADHCDGEVLYSWTFGDGATSLLQNPSHVYETAGTYSWFFSASADGEACTKQGTISVTDQPGCTVTCTASVEPGQGPAPLLVTHTATADAMNCTASPVFLWRFGDGATSTEPEGTHTYAEPGTYLWELLVEANGVTCSRSGSVAVEPTLCTVDCTASASPDPVRAGDEVRFTATVDAVGCTGDPTYLWTFGDGATSLEQNPTHAYGAVGDYSWTFTAEIQGVVCTKAGALTVTDPCTVACSAAAEPLLGIVPLNVAFSAAAETSNCLEPAAFHWDFGDGVTSMDQNPVHTYSVSGEYDWTMTATAEGATCIRQGTVGVSEASCVLTCQASAAPSEGLLPLEVSFSSELVALDCNESPEVGWDFGDGTASDEADPVHVYQTEGVFTWILTVETDGVRCTRTGTVSTERVPGDGDGDGVISLGEVQQVINMFLGEAPAGNGADCDGDGVISIGEVQRVINGFLGLGGGCP